MGTLMRMLIRVKQTMYFILMLQVVLKNKRLSSEFNQKKLQNLHQKDA